jgi:hypothetical protein
MTRSAGEFGKAIDEYACRQVTAKVEDLLRPSPLEVFDDETSLWEWYKGLSPEQHKLVLAFAEAITASACFNFCAMLDGTGGVAPFDRGTFELYYVERDKRYRVNTPHEEMLHTAFSTANVARRQRFGP